MTLDEWVIYRSGIPPDAAKFLGLEAMFEGFLRLTNRWCRSSLPHSPHFCFKGSQKKASLFLWPNTALLFGVCPSSNMEATPGWYILPLLQTSSPSRPQLSAWLSPGESKWDPSDRNNSPSCFTKAGHKQSRQLVSSVTSFNLHHPEEEGCIFILILQMKKLRPRAVRGLV